MSGCKGGGGPLVEPSPVRRHKKGAERDEGAGGGGGGARWVTGGCGLMRGQGFGAWGEGGG